MPRQLLTFIAAQLLLCLSVIAQAQEDIPRLLIPDGLPSDPIIIDGGGAYEYPLIGSVSPLVEGYQLHFLGDGLSDAPSQIVDMGDAVYFTGDFDEAYNRDCEPSVLPVNGVVRWLKAEQCWQVVDELSGMSVHSMLKAPNQTLYVAGGLSGALRVFKLANNTWQELASFGTRTGRVSLAVDPVTNELYAQGDFESIEVNMEDFFPPLPVARIVLKVLRNEQWISINGAALHSQFIPINITPAMSSISYSPSRHGFYVFGAYDAFFDERGERIEQSSGIMFWSITDQRWYPLLNKPNQINFLSSVSIYELDSDSILIDANGRLLQYHWQAHTWTELASVGGGASVLLPDKKRLLRLRHSTPEVFLNDLSVMPVENSLLATLMIQNSNTAVTSLVLGEQGIYAGFGKPAFPLMSTPETPVRRTFNSVAYLEILDMDGDGVANADDHFPLNPLEWLDTDGDGIGDNADPDIDGDGIDNDVDNCPTIANPAQQDLDGDLVGDVCDALPADPNETVDTDGDGVGDNRDQFPEDPNRWFSGELPPERHGDAAKQAYAEVLVNVGDINGDGVADYAIGIPQYSPTVDVNGKSKRLNKAGRVELYSGKTSELLWAQNGVAAKQLFGSAIAAGLIDSDTQRDLAIGAPGSNKNSGAVQLCLINSDANQIRCKSNNAKIDAPQDAKGSLFGSSVAVTSAGQLLIGAPRAVNRSAQNKTIANGLRLEELLAESNETIKPLPLKNVLKKAVGAVYFINGQSRQVESVVYGAAANGEFGAQVLIDDIGNVLASAPRALKTGLVAHIQQDGALLLVAGKDGDRGFGRALASVCQSQWKSPWPGYEAGWYTSCQHIIGAPQSSVNGVKQVGRVQALSVDDFRGGPHYAGEEIIGTSAGENFGASLAAVNSKAGVQLFVGSPRYSVAKTTASKALKHIGKLTQFELSADQAIAEQGSVLATGQHAGQQLGSSVLAMDLTGDFVPEVLIGSIGANDTVDKKLKAIGKVDVLSFAE